MIEKNIQDILNAGLGLFKAGEDNLQATLSSVISAFDELKTKGSTDNSAVAQKIREVLDNSIKGVQDVSTQAEENMKKILEETQKSYTQVLDQVRQAVGEEKIQDINNQFDDLASFVKTKADELTTAANSFAETVKEKATSTGTSTKEAPASKPTAV